MDSICTSEHHDKTLHVPTSHKHLQLHRQCMDVPIHQQATMMPKPLTTMVHVPQQRVDHEILHDQVVKHQHQCMDVLTHQQTIMTHQRHKMMLHVAILKLDQLYDVWTLGQIIIIQMQRKMMILCVNDN